MTQVLSEGGAIWVLLGETSVSVDTSSCCGLCAQFDAGARMRGRQCLGVGFVWGDRHAPPPPPPNRSASTAAGIPVQEWRELGSGA
jgi:hypothetical protein